jgi:mannose-6-phosphate isomerase-like protein (cupin superfamily)
MTGMAKVTSIQTAEHYAWGDGCDGWFLSKDEGIHIIQERMPPGASERRHVHNRSRQFFYVLRGELTLELESENVGMRAGEGLEIKPGVAHMARNTSNHDAEFIVISFPPSHTDRTNID